ncbi:MAG: argininosuccinate lyase [Deltaproteobacteria bacterium]
MAKKLWGGRFGKKTNPLVEKFTQSIQYDYKLISYDIIGSISHVEILRKAGYLTLSEAKKLTRGLYAIYKSVKNGNFAVDPGAEDIHTQIQNILEKKCGALALKLHTGRSRNDQVAFDTKLYCKLGIFKLQHEIKGLIKTVSDLASRNQHVIIPGFTHMQHAQPVYLKDHLGAYLAMFRRDSLRLDFIAENIDPTLGAGALAGTPIDANKYKGVVEPTVNSLDAVSDRDLVIETIGVLSILAMHLSRLAEDLIIWSTKEFDFVEIDEAFCTGSSLMPQKKNPDVLELIRGYTGRLSGNWVSVLTMMKGLPLAYNRDMQLDKEPLFNSFETVSAEVKVLSGLIGTLKFNKDKIAAQLKDESLYATDLVYYLVDKKVPFAVAHAIIGKLVRHSIDNDIAIKDMPESALKKFSEKIVKREIVKLFDPLVSVKSKKSIKR